MAEKSICDGCIHNNVCGEEGHLDPAMTFCAELVPCDVVGMLSRINGLRLSDIMGVLPSSWFTVTAPTGAQNDAIPYRHPEQYKVLKITYDEDEKKICVIVEKA